MTLHLLDSFLILIVNLYKAEIKIDILIVRKYIVVHIQLGLKSNEVNFDSHKALWWWGKVTTTGNGFTYL